MNSAKNGESFQCDRLLDKKDEIPSRRVDDNLRLSSGVGGDARARRLGRLDPAYTGIFVCDLQERFAPSIIHFDTIISNTERILKAANMLAIPTLATEQYPKVLFHSFYSFTNGFTGTSLLLVYKLVSS